MIPARHDRAFASIYGLYCSIAVRRRLSAILVRGSLPDTRSPLLVASQHVGRLDPLVLFHLSRIRPNGTHFVMMDAENLGRFGHLRRLGAFGGDRSVRSDTVGSLRYALARLAEPRSRVWMFPQGRLEPPDVRTIQCEPGAAWLAARARVPVVAVALRYELLDHRLPRAFVSFSEPILVERFDRRGADPIAALLEEQADSLADAIASGSLETFELASRRRSTDGRASKR